MYITYSSAFWYLRISFKMWLFYSKKLTVVNYLCTLSVSHVGKDFKQ